MLDPNTVTITAEMLSLIAEIDEFKGAWQLFGLLSPERLTLLRKVATIESIGSSTRIEGSKLSDREVEQLLNNLDDNSFASRDEQEVIGYAYVCEEVFERFAAIPFSENVIKQLHGDLLKFSSKDERHRGEYKKVNNHIEAFDPSGKSLGVICATTSALETPLQMEQLIFWTREQLEAKALHPLLLIGLFVLYFLAIHPFQDGNGRLSRVLTTLLLLKEGYAYVPYSSLESVVERNKEGYYLALRKAQGALKSDVLDVSPWLLFFLRALHKQKVHLEQKIAREKTLLLHVPELSHQILTLLHQHGQLSIKDIEALTGANRNTLKKHLSHLREQNKILQCGKARATWYTLL